MYVWILCRCLTALSLPGGASTCSFSLCRRLPWFLFSPSTSWEGVPGNIHPQKPRQELQNVWSLCQHPLDATSTAFFSLLQITKVGPASKGEELLFICPGENLQRYMAEKIWEGRRCCHHLLKMCSLLSPSGRTLTQKAYKQLGLAGVLQNFTKWCWSPNPKHLWKWRCLQM